MPCFILSQESLWDKLRPISVAVTHTIKHTHHHRHIGPAHLGMLNPVLSTSVSNTLLSEVCVDAWFYFIKCYLRKRCATYCKSALPFFA